MYIPVYFSQAMIVHPNKLNINEPKKSTLFLHPISFGWNLR